MPQEMYVVRCYSCETFQVHIVKKIPKWECKVCGEKQSLKKVYGRGSGKDCRLLVQELNQKRLEVSEEQDMYVNETIDITEINNRTQNVRSQNDNFHLENKSSGWAEFIPDAIIDTNNHSDNAGTNDNEISQYTFERPTKKRKLLKKSNTHVNVNPNLTTTAIPKTKSDHRLPPLIDCSSSKSAKNKDFKAEHKNITVQQSNTVDNKWAKFILEIDDVELSDDRIPLHTNNVQKEPAYTNHETYNKTTNTHSKDSSSNNSAYTFNGNERTRISKWNTSIPENETDLNYTHKEAETGILDNFPNSNNPVTTKACKLKNDIKCANKWDLFKQENKDIDKHKSAKTTSSLQINTNIEVIPEKKLKSSKWDMFVIGDENDNYKNESNNLNFENEEQFSCNKLLNVQETSRKSELKKEESMNKHKQNNEQRLETNQNDLKRRNNLLSFNSSNSDLDAIFML